MTKVKKKTIVAMMIVCACVACGIFLGFSSPKTAQADSNTTVATASITDQSGLGLGINVVTAENLNDFVFSNMVFDTDKLENLAVSKTNLNETTELAYSTTNINDLILNFDLNVNVGAEAKAFLNVLSANFKHSANFSYNNYNYKYYYIFDKEIIQHRLSINNYAQPATYQNCYSEYFLSDLQKLSNGTKSYEDFFADYGTHIVGSAIFGGRINAFYSMVSNKILLNSDISSNIGAKINLSFSSNTNAEALKGINAAYGSSYTSNDMQTAYYLEAYGGNAFNSTSMSNFETGVANWTNSFNNASNAVVIGYDNGLVPLWDILPENYRNLSDDMEAAFIDYYREAEGLVLEEFKTGNYKDFAGGSGAVTDPFLISNAQQLSNIENVSMIANYKLKNDIDLSGNANWYSIGGFYKDKAFNGVLDGAGHTIKGLKRTADITENNNRIYFGLFGYIGDKGVVKNLKFSNVAVSMNGPAVDNANTRVFVGVLAGSLYGTVQNVEIVSGTCSYNICTNGNAYVGGIAGVAFRATIQNCTNNANIVGGRYAGVAGGIVGFSTGSKFYSCKNTGSINAWCTGWGGNACAGGIAGEQCSASGYASTYENCLNQGTLTTNYYSWGIGCHHYRDDICSHSIENAYN